MISKPHRILLIAAIAVTLMVTATGIVSASPPVPPPNVTPHIIVAVAIDDFGTFTEDESLHWIYTTHNLSGNALEDEERVAQIDYEETLKAVDGHLVFVKTFAFNPLTVPNLDVDKSIGYVENSTSLISWLDSTENVGMSIVTEGDNDGPGGMEGQCPWAQGVCIPPGNEMIAAGSQLSRVDLVSAQTKTTVTTTDSPRLHHEIDARGHNMWGIWAGTEGPYGEGTVSAGMKVNTWEGQNCTPGALGPYPLASRLTYSELTSAKGLWKFSKTMTYEAQIPSVNIPREYPVFPE